MLLPQLHALQDDALITLDALAAADSERRALTAALYGAWRDIEDCRREEGFASTPARLVARAVAAAAADPPGAPPRHEHSCLRVCVCNCNVAVLMNCMVNAMAR